jgi:hypothetical protein
VFFLFASVALRLAEVWFAAILAGAVLYTLFKEKVR